MLPRTAGLLVLFTVLSVSTAGLSCFAQQAESATPVRYHFGDDTRWADPAFNDSAWPVAQDGRWPVPAFYSDGFVWARVRVPANAAGQLGIRLQYSGDGQVDALFVNGLPVTSESVASHNTAPSLNANDAVLELPPGRTLPGSTSVVAFRVSYRPETRMEGGFGHAKVEIDNSRILHLESHADHFSEVLANGPDLVLNVAILILGVALFSFWRWVGGRDVLLCSALLISYPVLQLFIDLSKLGLISVPFPSSALVYFALQAIGMAVTVEFIWTVHGLRLLPLKRLAQISFVVFNAAALLAYWPTAPLKFVSWSVVSAIVAAQVFNVITFAVNFSVLFFRKRNRLIAAALALIPVASILGLVGIRTSARIGPIHLAYFNLAFFLCEFALFFMLGQRAWRAWRARDELRVEFEAAREVQEQLVPPAVGVPGFEIESAYVPAKHVGGDFFRILPGADGSVLVVVGDVSGKGLKAAMTVSAIMGALHDYPSSRPTEVLAHLNRVLHGRVGGFVTCCVTLITTDGAMTLANAGNPAPYCNGEEMAVEAGLPLGMLAETSYAETCCQLAPGERLTFVSDGVIEATNLQRELYGFDRTRAISNQSANAIAEAATQFGQEDDITVVTLTMESVKAAASAQLSVPSLSI